MPCILPYRIGRIAGLNDRWRGVNGVVPRLCRLGFYPWQVLPRQTGSVPPANDWTSVNFSEIWWSLGIGARWMWLMQQMNHILKINGVYHKMVGGRATTESANGQDHPVQSANYCNHLRPRSPSSVSELLQPSVAPASAVGTSHRKTFFYTWCHVFCTFWTR